MLPAYTDLAPGIVRQRLVVEGYPSEPITAEAVKRYLSQLSNVADMVLLTEPVTHRSDLYGWAGWIHWETSGSHFYAWEKPLLFFSVDIYTCKEFDPVTVIEFTRDFFQATEITAKDFSSLPPAISPTAPAVQYTLSETELHALSERLLSEQPPKTQDALVLYRLEGTDELSNLGRHIERQVFEEKFNNTDDIMKRLYGPYESASDFFVVMDQNLCRPIGALRATKNSPAGLLTLHEAKKYAGISTEDFMKAYGLKSLDTVRDIGTIAIPKEYRSQNEHHVVAMIYRGAHLRGAYEGVTHYVALIDRDLLRTMTMVGFPFDSIMGSKPFEYEGSPDTTLVCGRPEEFFPSVARKAETSDGVLKLICTEFTKRFVHGHDIDRRIMFRHGMWPGGSSPLRETLTIEQARL